MALAAIAEVSDALRIATRGSELALRRARWVQAMLAERRVESELVPVRTAGDRHSTEPMSLAAARSAFSAELERALRRRKADLALHALPDLPTAPTDGLVIAAVLAREDPRDALIVNELVEAASLGDLPRGARVGTSSVRCRALLAALYPDVEVAHLHGDLRTRLKKVQDGQVHATIVPAAAMHRLDAPEHIAAYLEPPEWLPAPGQGATVIQARADDTRALATATALDDARARVDTGAERACLAALEGGPQSPVGVLARAERDGRRVLWGVIADPTTGRLVRADVPLDDAAAELSGVRLANELRARSASRILDALRGLDQVPAPQPDG